MRTRPAFRRFQLMRGAPPDSRRQGILAARGSSNSPHQKLCYAAGLDSHGLMKPYQPHASRIDPSFGRDRLAPLSLKAILQLFPSLFKLQVLPQPALFNPEVCGGSAPHEFLIRSALLVTCEAHFVLCFNDVTAAFGIWTGLPHDRSVFATHEAVHVGGCWHIRLQLCGSNV
jgi:hypothetical protein